MTDETSKTTPSDQPKAAPNDPPKTVADVKAWMAAKQQEAIDAANAEQGTTTPPPPPPTEPTEQGESPEGSTDRPPTMIPTESRKPAKPDRS